MCPVACKWGVRRRQRGQRHDALEQADYFWERILKCVVLWVLLPLLTALLVVLWRVG